MRVTSGFLRAMTIGFSATLLAVWVFPAGAQSGVTWSPELQLISVADITASMQAPVLKASQSLALTNGSTSSTVSNCQDYLNAVNAGFYPGNNLDNKLSASFVYRCYVLRDLQQARATDLTPFFVQFGV